MELKFKWSRGSENDQVPEAVAAIQDFADSPHWNYAQCHDATVYIELTKEGVFLNQIEGRVTCQCGAVLGALSGRSDGSHLKFSADRL